MSEPEPEPDEIEWPEPRPDPEQEPTEPWARPDAELPTDEPDDLE